MKRPAIQFYPGDWLRNVKVRACSVEARGLWMDLLCYMHDCEPYGHLLIGGKRPTNATIARMVGLPVRTFSRLLAELEDNGVCQRTADGILCSGRMIRDHATSQARAEAGSIGGTVTQAIVKQPVKQLPKQSVADEDADADAVAITPRRGVPRGETPDRFPEVWAAYPRRPNNSRERARKAYAARMAEGCDPAAILEGVKRYAAYVRRERTEPRYVKMTATFLGPDRHWESDYTSTAPSAAPASPVYPRYKPPKPEGPAYVPPAEGERDPRLSGLVGSIGRPMPPGGAACR